MKTIGIVGGIAPESTIVYYRGIVKACMELTNNEVYPPVVINSINMNKMLSFITGKDLKGLKIYLTAEIQKLSDASADFALLASNTPHIIFDELRKSSPLPLLSIVELTCEKAAEQGLKIAGLFGTKFTMQNSFYPDVFKKKGISVVTPDEKQQEYIHRIYFGELVKGIFLQETRERLAGIAEDMQKNYGIEAVILGGTELPLLIKNEDDFPGISIYDTTAIHIEGAVKEMFR